MKPNIEFARNSLEGKENFSAYSAAYVITNEHLRDATKFIPENTENALTVAASGDHPFFAKLYGAKHIDTFDLSYNAKLTMDIKTAALQILNYEGYYTLLNDLYASKDTVNIPNMAEIMKKLSAEEQTYLKGMTGCKLFCQGLHPSVSYDFGASFLSRTELEKLKKELREPFNFIWSDVKSLHTRLNKSYKFIHLSNIFDYISEADSIRALISLTQYTEPGCNICLETCFPYYYKDWADEVCKYIEKRTEQKWTLNNPKQTQSLFIMHRVR